MNPKNHFMKQLLTITFCLMVVFCVNAQSVEWGLKAGLQISQFRGDDFYGRPAVSSATTLDKVSTKGGMKTGYVIGGYVRGTEDVFLQAEMLVSIKGAELENVSSKVKTAIQYGQLDIPLSLGYKHKHLEISGGPLISVQMFDDNKLKTFLSQYSSSPVTFSPYRPYTLGYQTGIGFNFNKLSLGLRYLASIQGVSDMYISYNIPGDTQVRDSHFQQRFSSVQFMAAYRLTK
jgi:hypothetical protein